MWFRKFFSLLYISYLYCEKQMREFAVMIIGMVIMGILAVFCAPELIISGNLPPDFLLAFQIMNAYNDIVVTNLFIAVFWLIQGVLSVFFVNAILHVGYYYDNQSWCYVHSIRNGWAAFKNTVGRVLNAAGAHARSGAGRISDHMKIDETQADIQDRNHRNEMLEHVKNMKMKFK